jgi:pSer/pThr/pTyr-binding forkhead associated (FHA) protein
MTLASIAIKEVLLILKIVFLVLLYLFIWRIVRLASKDLRTPQESFVLAPQRSAKQAAASPKKAPRTEPGKIVVVSSPSFSEGTVHAFDAMPVTVGRGTDNDLPLQNDQYASGNHARFEPRGDGIWVEDAGSTNGTFVNGVKLTEPQRLRPGDVVRVGESDFRYEK